MNEKITFGELVKRMKGWKWSNGAVKIRDIGADAIGIAILLRKDLNDEFKKDDVVVFWDFGSYGIMLDWEELFVFDKDLFEYE